MGLKDRMQKAGPMWKRFVRRSDSMIRQAAIDGGAAGVLTVTDIRAGDKLISVIEVTTTTAALIDRTAEFGGDPASLDRGNGAIMTTDDQIDNTGGTATTGDALIVTWEAYDVR